MAELTQPLNAQLMRVGEGRQEAVPLGYAPALRRGVESASALLTEMGV